MYLAVAGVGKIILVRGGDLRLDDLNRQILMTNNWVGQPRVYKAKETILNINPDIQVEVIPEFVTSKNMCEVHGECSNHNNKKVEGFTNTSNEVNAMNYLDERNRFNYKN